MNIISVRQYLLITCITISFSPVTPALADWSGKTSQKRYNHQFGDFPPDDIDQHIQNSLDKYRAPTETSPTQSTEQVSPDQSALSSQQNYQQPLPQYNQQRSYNPRPNTYRNNIPGSNNTSFSGPWNNNGSNFSMPWGNNNGSSFNMPWGNNNGSNFSMPWGNNNWGNNNNNWNNYYRNSGSQ